MFGRAQDSEVANCEICEEYPVAIYCAECEISFCNIDACDAEVTLDLFNCEMKPTLTLNNDV